MRYFGVTVDNAPLSSSPNTPEDFRPLIAITYGPVADTAEPVAPQPVVTRSDSDGDDGDTVAHA